MVKRYLTKKGFPCYNVSVRFTKFFPFFYVYKGVVKFVPIFRESFFSRGNISRVLQQQYSLELVYIFFHVHFYLHIFLIFSLFYDTYNYERYIAHFMKYQF